MVELEVSDRVILLGILINRQFRFVIWWMENIKLLNFKIAIA
jgi:hypothetical protein